MWYASLPQFPDTDPGIRPLDAMEWYPLTSPTYSGQLRTLARCALEVDVSQGPRVTLAWTPRSALRQTIGDGDRTMNPNTSLPRPRSLEHLHPRRLVVSALDRGAV